MNPGGWYCFTCDSTPKEQLIAAGRVQRMNYAVFCPTREGWRSFNKYEKAKRRKEKQNYAIFPGYLFIRMPRNHLGPFFRTKPDTIYAVLSVAGEPYICSDDEIRTQAARHDKEFAPAHYRYFQTGHEMKEGEEAKYEPLGIDVVIQEISGAETTVAPLQPILGSTKPFAVETWGLRRAG